MPLTPFHLGPGLLAKGLIPRRFSWTAFVAANALIDCETVFNLIRNVYPVHTNLHTFAGATLAGTAAGAAAAGLVRFFPGPAAKAHARWPLLRAETTTGALLLGGALGGASHPFLDGIMHQDIRPFLPWTGANPLLGLVSLPALHAGCAMAGIIGCVLVWRDTRL